MFVLVGENLRGIVQHDEEMLLVGVVRRTGRDEQRRPPIWHEQLHKSAKSLSIVRCCSTRAPIFFASAGVRPSALKMAS